MSESNVVELLKSTPLTQLPSHEIIECNGDTKLSQAVSLLLKNNISSCPVRKPEYKDKTDVNFQEAYLGLIDILDIVAFVIEMNKTVGKWGPGFEAVLETLVQFSEHSVSDVMKSGPGIAFQCIESTSSIYDCLQLLGKDRFHRVVVVNSQTGQMSQIITQSSMARFLHTFSKTSESIQKFLENTIADFNLGKIQRVISLNINAKAVDAFNVIQRNRVTGVPVVDNTGAIVGNLSARDIRSLVGSPDKFDRLFDTLSEFLEGIREDKAGQNTSPVSTPHIQQNLTSGAFAPIRQTPVSTPVETKWKVPGAFTIDWKDTVGTALDQFVTKKIHRVYIVDENRHPVGVVTLTDLIRVFTEGKGDDTTQTRRGSLHKEYVE